MFSISSKKLFLFSRYSNFCIFAFPSFSPSQPLLESLIQDKLKVYDVINCLNNLTYFFWYLKKEKRYHVETLAIDTVLNKEHFYGKSCRKCAPNASPRPLFILVNNPKQPLHARNSFKNTIFWKGINKNLSKSKLYFFFPTQSLLMERGKNTK